MGEKQRLAGGPEKARERVRPREQWPMAGCLLARERLLPAPGRLYGMHARTILHVAPSEPRGITQSSTLDGFPNPMFLRIPAAGTHTTPPNHSCNITWILASMYPRPRWLRSRAPTMAPGGAFHFPRACAGRCYYRHQGNPPACAAAALPVVRSTLGPQGSLSSIAAGRRHHRHPRGGGNPLI